MPLDLPSPPPAEGHASVPAVDWASWTPRERAVLCFIVEGDRVLLIHKKRGLGAGKINAPGGKIEPGETPLAAAIRETQEEVGVTPTGILQRGKIRFQFTDGYALHCTIFRASGLVGEPIETVEAIPFWRKLDEVPYDQMWEDDRHWLPQMLQGLGVRADFLFDEDRMLTKQIEFLPAEQMTA